MNRFEAWERHNLAKFCQEAYARIQELEDMKTSHAPRIRELLRQTPDGMTVTQVGLELNLPRTSTQRALKGMPDAYIDRWTASDYGPWAAVWCVVVVPENCPKPTRKK